MNLRRREFLLSSLLPVFRLHAASLPAMKITQIDTSSIAAPELPGFGMVIKPEVWNHPAAVVQTTKSR